MQIEYEHVLPHPRERVWEVLLDPEVLSRVLPGVERFVPVGEEKFEVTMKLGVPSVRGVYSGSVEIADKQYPSSYKLRGEGKGGPGWARGEAIMTLVENGVQTRVIAQGKAQVGGTIAGVGQRMMEGVAKGMAREFFASIERELEGRKQKVGVAGFTFRMLLGMVQEFFRRLFRRSS